MGDITVLDGCKVTAKDCGSNFFVELSRIGESRAKVVQELLCELNPDVRGFYRDEYPESVITNEPSYFKKFNLVGVLYF